MFRSLGILFLSLFLFSAFALAQDQPQSNLTAKSDAWNKVCPIEGNSINQEIKMITYKDHKYGFCGEECAVQFKENPEAFIKNLNDDGTKFIGETKSKDPGKNK